MLIFLYKAEDKKAALPPGLAAAGKAEPCDEVDLQAAEEVSPRHQAWEVLTWGESSNFHCPVILQKKENFHG